MTFHTTLLGCRIEPHVVMLPSELAWVGVNGEYDVSKTKRKQGSVSDKTSCKCNCYVPDANASMTNPEMLTMLAREARRDQMRMYRSVWGYNRGEIHRSR